MEKGHILVSIETDQRNTEKSLDCCGLLCKLHRVHDLRSYFCRQLAVATCNRAHALSVFCFRISRSGIYLFVLRRRISSTHIRTRISFCQPSCVQSSTTSTVPVSAMNHIMRMPAHQRTFWRLPIWLTIIFRLKIWCKTMLLLQVYTATEYI